VAGPFDVEQEKLDALVTSALRRQTLTPGTTIH
jgi:hypothetical protein